MKSGWKRIAAVLVVCATAWVWTGCGGGSPAASLAVGASSIELPYGETVRVPLEWHCLRDLPEGSLHVFLHLLDENRTVVRTLDRPFSVARVEGCKVTTPFFLWQSVLGPAIEPGRYTLRAGLASEAEGRLPLTVTVEGEAVEGSRNAFDVLEVVVPEVNPSTFPEIELRGSWKPASPEPSLQLPGQRWLEGAGEIAVTVDRRLRLQTSLRILDAESLGLRTVLDEGYTLPRLAVSANCNAGGGALEGAGSHEVFFDLLPETFPAECIVKLDPLYTFIDPTTLDRSTVGLEKVTWSEYPPKPFGVLQ